MVVTIAERLGCTPNWLLGVPDPRSEGFADRELAERLLNAVAGMSAEELRLFVLQAEAVAGQDRKP